MNAPREVSQEVGILMDLCREHLGEEALPKVQAALEIALLCHEGQKRKSDGVPYITHPLHVAITCLEWGLRDTGAVCAALLHDAIEDAPPVLRAEERIRAFDEEVLGLVQALSKIRNLVTGAGDMVATYRRILSAASRDLRVLLIKSFDQLHNSRTLEVHSPAKAKIKASLGLIYVGIARRLGVQELADQLIFLLLPHLMPVQFHRAAKNLESLQIQASPAVEKLPELLAPLTESGLLKSYRLEPKKISDFFYLTEKPGTGALRPVGWPVFRLRLFVETEDDAWRVLGRVQGSFGPMPRHIRDYLNAPRLNGFKALTTRVVWNGNPLSLHVERLSDAETNQMGVLAHWGEKGPDMAGYMRLLATLGDTDLRMTEVHAHVLPDLLDVYTPRGDRLSFPAGSVVVDFAYRVHTDLGEHCIGGKINGIRCAPEQTLNDGDVVEILTARGATPQREWLEVVKSARARAMIKQALRDREIPVRGVERAKNGKFLITALTTPDIHWSTCCLPVPFDAVVGRLSLDGRWIVHRADCDNVRGEEPWEPGEWLIMTDTDILCATFTITHKPGALLSVLEVLAERNINGHSIQSKSRTADTYTISVEMGGKCPEVLGEVLREIARVDAVLGIRQFFWRP